MTILSSSPIMVNPFSTNVPLLYPLKTSENFRFSDVFRGYRSGTLVEMGLLQIKQCVTQLLMVSSQPIMSNHTKLASRSMHHIAKISLTATLMCIQQ